MPADQLDPFVRSLRSTSYQGRLAIIAAKYDPATLDCVRRKADLLVTVDDCFADAPAPVLSILRRLRSTRGLRRFYPSVFTAAARAVSEHRSSERWQSLEFALEGLQSLRYEMYYDFVRRLTPLPDYILLTDLRDVLFQGDPFEASVSGLEFYLEDRGTSIGDNPFNRRWIAGLRGRDFLDSCADSPISCSGTVVGPTSEILDYLHEMSLAISWRRRPMGPTDQGIHNVLLLEGQFPGASLCENGSSRVLTMGAMTEFIIDQGGIVLNANGTVPSVLHQYDRHPDLAATLLRRLTRSTPSELGGNR